VKKSKESNNRGKGQPNRGLALPLAMEFSILEKDNPEFGRHVEIPKNGFLTFVGPNGSGKSHLLRGLFAAFMEKKRSGEMGRKKVRFLSSGRLMEDDIIKRRGLLEEYRTLQERADIQLKVRARLRESFKRDINLHWGINGLEVNFEHEIHLDKPEKRLGYTIGQEASGLVHLVGLLTALYNDEIGVLIIDEPEISLHPQYQNFILQEMRSVCGEPRSNNNKKIIILATHSPEFLELKYLEEDISSFCVCENIAKGPIQITEMKPEFEGSTFLYRISYQYKKALFAKTILLVEGDTDELILRGLAEKLEYDLESRGIEIVAVGSKEDFRAAMAFFREINKEVQLLADIDWLVDKPSQIDEVFGWDLGFRKSVEVLLSEPWPDNYRMRNALRNHSYSFGRYRAILNYLKPKFDQERLNTLEVIAFLEKSDFDYNELKSFETALRRVSFCELLRDSTEMQGRMDRLESRGAFLIRVGEIESCYLSDRVQKKRLWAHQEYRLIQTLPVNRLEKNYGDLIRCLQYCGDEPENIELHMLHNRLNLLLMSLSNDYQKGQDLSLKRHVFQANEEGIFEVKSLGDEGEKVRIALRKSMFPELYFSLVFALTDSPVEIKNKIDDIFRRMGLQVTRGR